MTAKTYTRDEVRETFIDVLADAAFCDRGEVPGAQRLADDLRLDSLAMIEVVMELEDEFDVNINDEYAEKLAGESFDTALYALCQHLGVTT